MNNLEKNLLILKHPELNDPFVMDCYIKLEDSIRKDIELIGVYKHLKFRHFEINMWYTNKSCNGLYGAKQFLFDLDEVERLRRNLEQS